MNDSDAEAIRRVVIIGGGPAGLMAAEVISAAGHPVALYDSMRTVGRKFLLAGKGGLNLTHSEPIEPFLDRYGARRAMLAPIIADFDPTALRRWAGELGVDTFIGSSGRVFPADMKAAPLLRAWLARLRAAGVLFHMRHRWQGWDEGGRLHFSTPDGSAYVRPAATVLALGGGSWPKLGSTGLWVPLLAARGVAVAPLRPANCGFDVAWSDHFRTRFAGRPVKGVAIHFDGPGAEPFARRGEFVISDYGVEGSLIYAVSAQLRDAIDANGAATIYLDLAPDRPLAALKQRLAQPRGRTSQANHWRRQAGITGVKAGLLREFIPAAALADPAQLAAACKRLPILVQAARPLAEAISSAGGVSFTALSDHLMLRALPGVFCAGEMLDWEAPTGGYLLTACFATGRTAGTGVVRFLETLEV